MHPSGFLSLSVRCGNDRYPAAPACAQSDHSIRGIPFIRPFSARALFAEYRFIPALHGGALLLRILLIELCSLLCFYTTGYLGISWTRNAIFEFFSGALIPIVMFPGWLKSMAYMTPFPYMIQIPISILLGQELNVALFQVYAVQFFWIGIFLGLHGLFYKNIRKNLIIAGG